MTGFNHYVHYRPSHCQHEHIKLAILAENKHDSYILYTNTDNHTLHVLSMH